MKELLADQDAMIIHLGKVL